MAVFAACIRATGLAVPPLSLADTFFFGQLIGLASLIPGGFGSSDAFWIARLPFDQNITAAALTAYRFIYYIGPWFTASLLLLSFAFGAATSLGVALFAGSKVFSLLKRSLSFEVWIRRGLGVAVILGVVLVAAGILYILRR